MARHTRKAATTPEYLRVETPGRSTEDYDVLINGESNGKVGQLLQLTTGTWEVSIDGNDAPPAVIKLEGTTINRPMVVEIITQ